MILVPANAITAPTRAIIDLAALRHNIDIVKSCNSPGTLILAMLKANAYGHGLLEIAREAAVAGVEFFGIARVEEGLVLRRAGFRQHILLLEIVRGERADVAISEGLDLTVASLSNARELDKVAAKLGKRVVLHVKVDTGMGRIGMHHAAAAKEIVEIATLRNVTIGSVFSHFATSEDPDQTFAREQLGHFHAVLENLDREGVKVPLRHFANSGAIMTLPEAHFDMVRAGIMLYGYAPGEGMDARGLRPVMSLVSTVNFLKTVEAGTSISYNRRYYVPETTRIATVLAGYGDGFSRLLTGKGHVLIKGRRYPLVGTVCMDMIMVDVGMDEEVQEGDSVTLIGQDGAEWITAWDIASLSETIPYEITCHIAGRIPLIYVNPSGS